MTESGKPLFVCHSCSAGLWPSRLQNWSGLWLEGKVHGKLLRVGWRIRWRAWARKLWRYLSSSKIPILYIRQQRHSTPVPHRPKGAIADRSCTSREYSTLDSLEGENRGTRQGRHLRDCRSRLTGGTVDTIEGILDLRTTLVGDKVFVLRRSTDQRYRILAFTAKVVYASSTCGRLRWERRLLWQRLWMLFSSPVRTEICSWSLHRGMFLLRESPGVCTRPWTEIPTPRDLQTWLQPSTCMVLRSNEDRFSAGVDGR